MFHAVGLNVMDARERKSDDLDVSTRALKDMIDRQTAHVVVENRPEDVADRTCYAHANRSRALLRTCILSPRQRLTGSLLVVYSYEMWNNNINAYSTWYRVFFIRLHASNVMANQVCRPFNWRTLRLYVFRI